ncbi:carnitine dehydratase [Chromatiales bacterium (ex Bugula neritina AB1)]|nr:carnitine dehydratase [Chromatiales bacterium (ex Bugula neritina AB1)]
MDKVDNRPLAGIKVLELGQLVAGPQAGCILGYFGAEIIKVESPGKGDPIRHWRLLDEDGTSYWWHSIGRNKKSVTINLKTEAGRDIVRQLVNEVDVVLENFRPGTLEKWGLGPETFKESHPSLIFTRVSGYGQTGPLASRPGYASACEAFGGFRHVNGFADGPPVRPNLSLGDTLAGMHAVIGVLLALLARKSADSKGKSNGQVVDVSIFESVFNMMEAVVPEYSGGGQIREPSGSTITGIVPTNTYLCDDGKYVVIGGNGDSIFKRLMCCAGREDMAEDSRLADNTGRVKHEQEIDEAICRWTEQHSAASVLQSLEQAEVPCGPIYSVADMMNDPHYRARGLFETVAHREGTLEVPAILPRLNETPGRTDQPAPELGAHTDEILSDILDFSADKIQALKNEKIV